MKIIRETIKLILPENNNDSFYCCRHIQSYKDIKQLNKSKLKINETVQQTGRTVLKAIIFNYDVKPSKDVMDFEDFEVDGLYRLGENDYIAFEKRCEYTNSLNKQLADISLIHQDIADHFIEHKFKWYNRMDVDEICLEMDNLSLNEKIKKNLYKYNEEILDSSIFSKYKHTIMQAMRKYFR